MPKRKISDEEKHKIEESADEQLQGEESMSGSTPLEDDIDKATEDEGIYTEGDPQHPDEVNIAEEEKQKEKKNVRGY